MTGRRQRETFAVAAVGLVLLAWAVAPLVLAARMTGGELTGGVGHFPADQLQYMAWVREAGEHLLASNLFQLEHSDRIFLHPMFVVSGALWRAAMPIQLAFLLWIPVAVAALVASTWAYIGRLVDGSAARLAALVLALFYAAPIIPVADRLSIGERWTSSQPFVNVVGVEADHAYLSWGYYPTLISVALLALTLVLLDRPTGRRVVLGSASALLCSWLHPWQGQALLIVLGAAALLDGDLRASLRRYLAAGLGALLPIAYYFVLSRIDTAWELASRSNAFPLIPWWALLAGLLPLALPAPFGLRLQTRSLLEMSLWLWPLACLVAYFVTPSFRYHAFEGISIPLGVLAVRGWQRIRLRASASRLIASTAALALVTVPANLLFAFDLDDTVRASPTLFALEPDEVAALAWLDDPDAEGDVLAPWEIGASVPARTGRRTWVGHGSWSPAFPERAATAERFFAGRMNPKEAQRFVTSTGARFLLAGCRHQGDIQASLGPELAHVEGFGCARVYVLR